MAITQAIANAFKQQLLEGDANFKSSGGDVFKLALYTSSATLNSTTTAYSATNEVANSGQYTARRRKTVASSRVVFSSPTIVAYKRRNARDRKKCAVPCTSWRSCFEPPPLNCLRSIQGLGES